MGKQVVLYEWPDSQICMDCVHGDFVNFVESSRSSDYICTVNCEENDGVNCPEFKPREDKTK